MSDLTTRTRIGNTVNTELLKEFKQLSKDTKIPMSRLLDEAIEDLLKKYKNRSKPRCCHESHGDLKY